VNTPINPKVSVAKSKEKSPLVFCAMSGGVDSSVAALLLKKQGYNVVGVFMRCFNVDGCEERDAEDARRVAAHIGIPFYIWDFEKEYKQRVVEYMVEGYRAGITPNPDVMCNREIKFGIFLDKALSLGADYIATGHYVRIRANSKEHIANSHKRAQFAISYKLYAALDAQKDQSYFLWTLTQKQLRHCIFPIGDYVKPEVRAMAKKAGLPTADKKDSQGICFLGKVPLGDFLKTYIPERTGAVLNSHGEKIGEHSGAHFYTIGQRHIGLGDRRQVTCGKQEIGNRDRKPVYVSEKDIATNAVIVVEGSDNPALYKKEIVLHNLNFIGTSSHSLIRTNEGMEVFARVRYRQPLAKAELRIENSEYRLIFREPQKFVAPGQSAVFYSKRGELIGGGIIS